MIGDIFTMNETLLNYDESTEFALKDFFDRKSAMQILPGQTMSRVPLTEMWSMTKNNGFPPTWSSARINHLDHDLIHNWYLSSDEVGISSSSLADHQFVISLGKEKIGGGFAPYCYKFDKALDYFVALTKVVKNGSFKGRRSSLLELLVLPGKESVYNSGEGTVTFLWLKTTSEAIRDHGNDWIKDHWVSTDIK